MTNKDAAIKIIDDLHNAGFRALLAGGCVRDMLLNRPAKDYDVATDAKPGDVTKLFKRTVAIGAKFGVVMVMIGSEQVEVATFRTESGYADGRHPAKVEFSNAEEDAGRRDFTVNGMFYNPIADEVIDYVGGQDDLANKILRAIGDPAERFGEDYLRMLRAIRFSTQLGFEIESATWQAVCRRAECITQISGERIAMELEAILTDMNRSKGATLLTDSGLGKAIFPGFGPEESLLGIQVLSELRENLSFSLALAAFFAGCETDFALERCGILKLSRVQIKHLRFLLTERGILLNVEMSLAELKLAAGEPYFGDLYQLQRAIQVAKADDPEPLDVIKKRVEALSGVELRPKPLLDGYELIALGAQPGPMVGVAGEEMYIAQLAEEITTPQQARAWVADWLKKHEQLKH